MPFEPFLQFSGHSRTPRTFLGSFLVLDIRLISPVVYSASIYCPCRLHTLFMALKHPNTPQNDTTTTYSHQNTQIFSGATTHKSNNLSPSSDNSKQCLQTPPLTIHPPQNFLCSQIQIIMTGHSISLPDCPLKACGCL